MDEEYSDKMEPIEVEWKSSYTKLKAKLHYLEKNITFIDTNVLQTSLVQPNLVSPFCGLFSVETLEKRPFWYIYRVYGVNYNILHIHE